ncbi:MAG TPA: tRNA pseudouridine(55) synthase TruB [Gemmataceae bacterium]|nr:tRNA pseudouridine(55) synthase TruB [Gemmataceae bacterium]
MIDKPGGLTSRDVVDRAGRWFPRGTRLGHTGTLDPLATGVLVLCVGVATRLGEYIQRMPKTYRAGVYLGARSNTDDADGVVETVPVERPPDRTVVARALGGFVGDIAQVPPAFSAAKVTGRRAYEVARRGEHVALEPRRVHIDQIELISYAYPRLDLEVRCGKGTYIRSLARDLGERLGCGALVETLRRTRVGAFDVVAALPLEADTATARAALVPFAAAVTDLPRVVLEPAAITRLRHGQGLALGPACPVPEAMAGGMEVAVFDAAGTLGAVAVVDPAAGLLRPLKVLPADMSMAPRTPA